MARVHWDEPTIAEHDVDRGTRMKIDEPNTPFARSPDAEDVVNSAQSSASLEGVASVVRGKRVPSFFTPAKSSVPVPSAPSDQVCQRLNQWLDTRERRRPAALQSPKADFSVLRKQHYNEALVIRELKKQGSWDSMEKNDDEAMAKKDFAARRKQHYNEAQMLKKAREAAKADLDNENP